MARIEHAAEAVPFTRTGSSALAGLFLVLWGCADAPITQDQLREDGELRQQAPAVRSAEQAAFHRAGGQPVTQRAAQISAVLAEGASGPLSDQSRFESDVGTVHLHLRADGLTEPREVVFRWTHELSGDAVLVPGTLLPAETLRHVATHEIGPGQTGAWTVEVLAEAPGPDGLAEVLWQRGFEVAAVAEDVVAENNESSLH